ncbi:MAG TPA: hypothetical protein VHF22_10130, partial [Planctomycetota bacterium]|nr:hypothetical protein [Planctomycetota bacterium]
MALALERLRAFAAADPRAAWGAIFEATPEVFEPSHAGKDAAAEVSRREQRAQAIDLFLAGAGWDLWDAYPGAVPRTADAVATWWEAQIGGRAVLVLDGLSMREAPWIRDGAAERGFTVHELRVTGTELPPETTPFARALGVAQRSAFAKNDGGKGHRLPGARADVTDIPFADCADRVGAEPRWFLWHEWPDARLHALAATGQGLRPLMKEAAQQLAGAGFWKLIERLATGRRLVVTSDHGYAATGDFPDVGGAQAQYLKARFGSGRSAPPAAGNSDVALPFVPPLDLLVGTAGDPQPAVLGRRKWKSQGGYPLL